ncbi:MAG: hypothetical protein WBE74_02895, partial [Terracidiphilus sp.]
MGFCTLTVYGTKIVRHKSDSGHADNDWVNLVVTVNDQVAESLTFQLCNLPKFAGQSQVNIFGDGDNAATWGCTVPCQNQDTVIMTYTIINLSATQWSDQVTGAEQFTEQVAEAIAGAYLQAAEAALGLATGVLSVADIIERIAEGGDPVIDKLTSAIDGIIGSIFTDVLNPALNDILNFLQGILGNQPNCNGLVLQDYVIFPPSQRRDALYGTKEYQGPSPSNGRCGTPDTILEYMMTRQLDPTSPIWKQHRPGENIHKAHILHFEKQINKLQHSLGTLGGRGSLKGLLEVIHRPGWTTIAENTFFTGIVDAMIAQTKVLATMKQTLLGGAAKVEINPQPLP